jgi:pimeloyl-ACP methyl ester carboxylesterase
MQINQVYFRSNAIDLYGALFIPESGTGKDAYIVCHPFAEEKKSSQKPLVDFSRRLARRGKYVLMFDFQGCGDSQGKLSASTAQRWLQNIDDAIAYLKSTTGLTEISVVGLRAAATILWHLAKKTDTIQRYILFEPVHTLQGHLENLIKQKMVNELLTYGRVKRTKELLIQDLQAGNAIDIDGHEVSSELYHSFIHFDNEMDAQVLDTKIKMDIISLSISGTPSSESEKFYRKIQQPACVNFQAIKVESFWNKIDGVNIDPLLAVADSL